MAGAVAFVFGLCALSFAAGCVVTAVMLRRTDPADEAPQPGAPPQAVAPPEPVGPPAPRLLWPPDDVVAKPIHRNPVVGLPALVSLDHGDPAPAALALAPDPTFAGVFDPPPARLPAPAEEPLDRSLEDELPEPAIGRVLHARSTTTGYALRARREPASKRSPHAEQAILLTAACGPTSLDGAVQPITLRVVADLPQAEEAQVGESHDSPPLLAGSDDDRALPADLEVDPVPSAESVAGGVPHVQPVVEESDHPVDAHVDSDQAVGAEVGSSVEPESESGQVPAESALPTPTPAPEAEKPVQFIPEPPAEPVAPVRRAVTGPAFPTARNGKRREIKLELVPQSEPRTPEPEAAAPEPEAAASEVAVTDVEVQPVVVPESETLFVSRSGLVAEPASPTSDSEPEVEAVVPEQGAKSRPVVPKQHAVPNDEFRKRYLRTFEAARRRSNH